MTPDYRYPGNGPQDHEEPTPRREASAADGPDAPRPPSINDAIRALAKGGTTNRKTEVITEENN